MYSFKKKILCLTVRFYASIRVGQGGSGIPVYPKKIRQNTQKYPKFIQICPKLYPGILYTWNSKKLICRIPDLKSPCIPYTQKPWPTLIYELGFCQADVYDLRFPFSPKFRKFRLEIKWKGLFGITFEGSLISVGKRPMSISLPLDLYYESNTYPWGPHRPCVVQTNLILIGTHNTSLQHLTSPGSSYASINVDLRGGRAITGDFFGVKCPPPGTSYMVKREQIPTPST